MRNRVQKKTKTKKKGNKGSLGDQISKERHTNLQSAYLPFLAPSCFCFKRRRTGGLRVASTEAARRSRRRRSWEAHATAAAQLDIISKIPPKIRFKENSWKWGILLTLQFDNKIWSIWWPETEIMWLLSISKSRQKLDSKNFVKMRDHTSVYYSLTIKYEAYDDRKWKSCDCFQFQNPAKN